MFKTQALNTIRPYRTNRRKPLQCVSAVYNLQPVTRIKPITCLNYFNVVIR